MPQTKLFSILGSIAQGDDLACVLTAICHAVEQASGRTAMFASILIHNAETGQLRLGAAPNLPEAYSRAIDGIPVGPRAGSCGTAVFRRELVVVEDIETDPLWTDYRHLLKSSGLRACWSQPIFGTTGQLLGTFAFYLDRPQHPTEDDLELARNASQLAAISLERERTERQLRQSEQRLNLAMEQTRSGMWEWHIPTGRGFHNGGFERMLEFEPGELETGIETWSSRIHPDDLERVGATLQAYFDGTIPHYECEHRLRTRSGSWIWVLSRGSVVERDAEGRPVQLIGIITDITKRKAFEARLQQIQKMEAIGQLTGGIAHDFNNLLLVIIGHADMLTEAAEVLGHDDLRDDARQVQTAARRAADLTRHLLAFSRQQTLSPAVVDIAEVVNGVTGMLRRTLGENIEIATAMTGAACLAVVDRSHLENAILNLAINARDAMPEGGRLLIETGRACIDTAGADEPSDIAPGDYVTITLTDTGLGMAPEVVAQAFEPFFTTKEVGKGSGLGLSMVYGFVKQSGGHVTLYSEEGRGTSVKIYLPQGAVQDKTAINAPSKLPTGKDVILVVEDDPMVQGFIVKQLVSLGYETHLAGDAQSALATLGGMERVDLLFTDIVMPGGMDGHQLAAEARRRRPGLKVLFTSGYSQSAAASNDWIEADACFLQKPYRRAQLAQALRSAIEGTTTERLA